MRPEKNEIARSPGLKKCTLDTSIWVSYLIGGKSIRPLVQWLLESEEWTIVVSDAIEMEVREVLGRAKFDHRRVTALALFERCLSLVLRVSNLPTVEGCSDPDDNIILACGAASHSDVILTGDAEHLVSMKSFRGIPIMNAAQFRQWFRCDGRSIT